MDEPGTDFLLQRCRDGNLEAFEQLITLYKNKIYGLCLRLTGNPTDAQDLAQDAFIRLYRALPGFRGQSAFTTWFYRIVANLWSNEVRKRSRQRTVPLDAPLQAGDGDMQRALADAGVADPDESLAKKEEREMVWRAINSLSQEHRAVLVLREMYDMSYEEIARSLECSEGTVKSRLYRARKSLRELLSDKISEHPEEKPSKRKSAGQPDFNV